MNGEQGARPNAPPSAVAELGVVRRLRTSPVIAKPTKSRRLRRVILWLAAFVLAVFAVFVVVPSISALRARHWLASAIGLATSIRLEEFKDDSILTSRQLDQDQGRAVLRSLSLLSDAGVPGLIKFCYIPHHRIIVSDSSGTTRCTMSVCFGCEQFAFDDDSDVAPTPFAWRQPLRRLFEVPPTT